MSRWNFWPIQRMSRDRYSKRHKNFVLQRRGAFKTTRKICELWLWLLLHFFWHFIKINWWIEYKASKAQVLNQCLLNDEDNAKHNLGRWKGATSFHTGLLSKEMVFPLEHLDHALSGLSNTNPLDLRERKTKRRTHIEELKKLQINK